MHPDSFDIGRSAGKGNLCNSIKSFSQGAGIDKPGASDFVHAAAFVDMTGNHEQRLAVFNEFPDSGGSHVRAGVRAVQIGVFGRIVGEHNQILPLRSFRRALRYNGQVGRQFFVRPFVGSKAIGYADKSRLEFRMKLASMNRVGTPATDFKFIIYPKENASSLRATAGKELLLVFYDPECEGCHETLMELMKSDVLAQRVAKGDVSVLAVYTEGNLEVWRKTAPGLPETWTIAADTSCLVKNTPLYDLKAMPTLYLLDTQKNVVLKDTSIPALMSYWTEGA